MWLCWVAATAWAAGGGEVTPIVIVADTRHLSGVQWFVGSLYNHSAVGFTLLTIAVVPLTGVLFGLIADVVLAALGIDLRHRGVAEH